MRDYDESFKEMKKENFNLKLRIFFLEERLGQGKKTNVDELANANLELKVRMVWLLLAVFSYFIRFLICAIIQFLMCQIQLESCKQDLAEKNVLLAEASGALGINYLNLRKIYLILLIKD